MPKTTPPLQKGQTGTIQRGPLAGTAWQCENSQPRQDGFYTVSVPDGPRRRKHLPMPLSLLLPKDQLPKEA
ncbi:hypothetical protein MUN82_04015 [Hymenobacter aerilatus]|uniref:Uncharacterized protein n=1 Tax=Hymenobacter aerilatus TaxID=2932251 RepID=A0A8T9SWR1_9BACT|nr:hypothetical protein [Hymenobacter aerilatus]UOR06265.1 hypothetical protein MUN82_04015 [Hymenobacter aerilatus]